MKTTADTAADPRDAVILRLQRQIDELTLARAGEAVTDSRLTMDGIPGFVATLAPDGSVQSVNRQIIEFTGQPLEVLKHWGTNGTVHPEDMPHVAEVFLRSIASGDDYYIEQRLRRADGVYLWFGNRGTPSRDASGRIVCWYVLLTDIEEKRQGEEALRESERQARLIVQSIAGMVAVFTPTGELEYVNQQLLDFYGNTRENLDRWTSTETVHPADLPLAAARFAESLASGQPFEMKVRARRFDGVYRWLESRGLPLRDTTGRIARWYNLLTDIDDRMRAEHDLRRSEAFLAQAQELTQTGSLWWNVATRELVWSDEIYRILECPRTTQPSAELALDLCHPDDLAFVQESIGRSADAGTDLDIEHRMLLPNGSIKHVHVVLQNIEDETGAHVFVGAVTDITERKVAEQKLRRSEAALARLTRSMSLGALTASIAHEVNQPLAGIITNANTCLRMLAADPPNVAGALETARRTLRDGTRASEVISRLRALFRKRDVPTEAVDLNEAAREVIALSSQHLQRRRLTLDTELDAALPRVQGDRIQLQQVILNLLSNASECMETVDDRPRRISVRTTLDEAGAACFAVRDTGIGIAPEAFSKLFDTFYTTKEEGMGIGLSVSRFIIESHHGRLWCEPNDGPGVTFAFSIPVAAQER